MFFSKILNVFIIFSVWFICPGCYVNGSQPITQLSGEIDSASSLQFSPKSAMPRYALVIGNGNYDKLPKLTNTINDAVDIEHKLEGLQFEVSSLHNANLRDMETSIDNLLDRSGVRLLYYSGHGIRIYNGSTQTNYLIPVDAKLQTTDDVPHTSISLAHLLDRIQQKGQKNLNIIILDACRDNPLPTGTKSSIKGLAGVDAPAGTIISYATGPNKVANEVLGERNSLYTKFLKEALNTPNLTIEKMFKEVRKAVLEASNGTQIPWESNSLINEFYFAKSHQDQKSEKMRKLRGPEVSSTNIGNLIFSDNFEEGLKNWKQEGKGIMVINDCEGNGKCIKIAKSRRLGSSYIMKTFKGYSGSLRCEGKIKSTAVVKGQKRWDRGKFQAIMENETEMHIRYPAADDFEGDSLGWETKHFDLYDLAPQDVFTIRIGLQSAKGTVLVDDIKIFSISK